MNRVKKMHGISYNKFSLMMVISLVIMYGGMFLNVTEATHVYVSTITIYMALPMVFSMAIVIMLMMGKMYPNKN